MTLTYEQSRQISIWIWEIRVKEGWEDDDKTRDLFIKKWKISPEHFSGLCIFFAQHCSKCPMYWKDVREERYSAWEKTLVPCSRSMWHWMYWILERNRPRARYWACKMLAEIKATPEHEEGNAK
jgi:hypothetical protein